MNLELDRKRLARIEQEAEALRAYIAKMEAIGEMRAGLPFSDLSARARHRLRVAHAGLKPCAYGVGLDLDPEKASRLKDTLTPEEVSALSRAELLRITNFGRKSMNEVEAWLLSHGLELSP